MAGEGITPSTTWAFMEALFDDGFADVYCIGGVRPSSSFIADKVFDAMQH
jgi:hypothetical protein